MSHELLLEIGTEEIPAAFMPDALQALKNLTAQELTAGRIDFKDIQVYGTPRRLVLMASGVADRQKELVTQKIGPAKRIAYDPEGNPTKAAVGFARGQGLDVARLTTVVTEKGEYLCAEIQEAGRETEALLPELLPRIIGSIPFPKSMRWHSFDMRFARPMHWILALFAGRPVAFKLESIRAGSSSYGHRFMAPGPIEVSSCASYREQIKKAHVVIDPNERKNMIRQHIRHLAREADGVPDEDEQLLDEVSWLVEVPFPVLCSFKKEFLKLPKEVLLTTMKKHQRYFPVLDSRGAPRAHFIAINNTDVRDPRTVISGHERVLRARLADAQFFYLEDQKKPLASMTEQLKQVVFQSKLGTSYEKVVRFQELALFIIETFVNPSLKTTVERAAYLCKADLVSQMVGEFPELQGIMGREYARLAGEPDEVCRAIFEHYLPRFAGDELPATDAGAVISIADKLDTIAGCFGVGLIPTGTADPYALRRQCLGIINIVLDKKYAVSLGEVVRKAIGLLEGKLTRSVDEISRDVLGFFSGRLANMLTSQGYAYDAVDAVLARGIDNLADSLTRIEALHRMKQDADFESLAVSFKRVVNILAGAAVHTVDPSLLQDAAEKALYQKYLDIRDQVRERMAQKSYIDALKILSTIREAVDGFFDNVMVMAKDERLKQNRLALLHEIHSLFTNFADFARIASE